MPTSTTTADRSAARHSSEHYQQCVSIQVHLLIDETNKAIVDFSRAVSLQPNFPVAHVQKLYTDYRAATTIGRNTDRHHIALDHFL